METLNKDFCAHPPSSLSSIIVVGSIQQAADNRYPGTLLNRNMIIHTYTILCILVDPNKIFMATHPQKSFKAHQYNHRSTCTYIYAC